MTRDETAYIAKLACASWRPDVTAEQVAAFHIALKDHSIDDALEALSRCLKQPERRFAVTPPELLGAIRAMHGANAPTPPAVVSQSAPMLERYWRNGREYIRASHYGRRGVVEWNKRAAREGAEAKAKRRAAKPPAAVPDNHSDGGGSP